MEDHRMDPNLSPKCKLLAHRMDPNRSPRCKLLAHRMDPNRSPLYISVSC